jgi:hypothetical protein
MVLVLVWYGTYVYVDAYTVGLLLHFQLVHVCNIQHYIASNPLYITLACTVLLYVSTVLYRTVCVCVCACVYVHVRYQ